jgi:hypothetical protein
MRSAQYPVPSTQYDEELRESWLTNFRFRVRSLVPDSEDPADEVPGTRFDVLGTEYGVRGT